MVEEQLRRRAIRDPRVLEAMERVPRELFVPDELRERAYDDAALPIGEGQTISQPAMVALICELLGLRGTERVLDVGTGSGYQAAVLAELAAEVHTVERLPVLAAQARRNLEAAGYAERVAVHDADGAWAIPTTRRSQRSPSPRQRPSRRRRSTRSSSRAAASCFPWAQAGPAPRARRAQPGRPRCRALRSLPVRAARRRGRLRARLERMRSQTGVPLVA